MSSRQIRFDFIDRQRASKLGRIHRRARAERQTARRRRGFRADADCGVLLDVSGTKPFGNIHRQPVGSGENA